MIDPNEIEPGDLVIIQDARGNVLSGPVVEAKDGMALKAFGFDILFATWFPQTTTEHGHGAWATVPGIKLIEHQPPMIGSELYIRSKAQLQRNKHLRSNPT